MEPFTPLSFAERVRYERFVNARNRRLRCQLRQQRSLMEAKLEERKLKYLSSLPAFKRLSDAIQGSLSRPFVRDQAVFLKKAARSLSRQKALDTMFSELRKEL